MSAEKDNAVFYNLEEPTLDGREEESFADAAGLSKKQNQAVQRPLLVVLKAGKEDGGRGALVAFSTALSSKLSGVETSIFLLSAGVVWARDGEIDKISIRGFEPLSIYFRSFVVNKGHIYVSLPCMRFFNDLDSVLERKKVIAGVHFAGLASLANMANKSTVLSF